MGAGLRDSGTSAAERPLIGTVPPASTVWQHRCVDLAEYNALSDAEASRALVAVCAAPRWVDAMIASRPYGSLDELLRQADDALDQLSVADLDAALAGHPKIGAQPSGPGGDQSRREQSGVDPDDAELAAALAEGNRAYEARFGRIYLVCASGRSGRELLAVLRTRLGNSADTELVVTRAELGQINRLRLERMVTA